MHLYILRWCGVLLLCALLSCSNAAVSQENRNPETFSSSSGSSSYDSGGIEILANNGSLSGYVYSGSMDPLVGATVVVFFHGTYEMDVTDAVGYYQVINISLCNCTKRVVASKEGFQGVEVFLSIYENTTYDFILLPASGSDLYCWGDLIWTDVYPGALVQGEIWVMNQGGGDLIWNITTWPEWGVWDVGLYFPILPSGGFYIVRVSVTAPEQPYANFTGYVLVENMVNGSDIGIVNASLSTQGIMGYTVSERILAFIWDLCIEENLTSFTAFLGLGVCVIEYDDGGMVAFVRPYLLSLVCWSGDFIFQGELRPHYVRGVVHYRVV